jgi:hypothetical protein
MFRNHLKIALCNLRKYNTISVFNLFGRAVGLVSYDQRYPQARPNCCLSCSLHTNHGFAIAFSTTAWQIIRTATTHPVKHLQTE